MIDTKELRRLAQAATPGPWIAKNISGAGLEIYMSHPVYPDKEWPAFGTDSAFCKKGLVSYETWTQFPHEVQDVQQSKNAEFIAAANPAVINELLDYLEAAEKERDWHAGRCEDAMNECAALRAKIEQLEKQGPVGVLHVGSYYGEELQDWEFEANQRACDKLNEEYVGSSTSLPLYALPGAKGE